MKRHAPIDKYAVCWRCGEITEYTDYGNTKPPAQCRTCESKIWEATTDDEQYAESVSLDIKDDLRK